MRVAWVRALSAYGRMARNYLTYFFVYSVRRVRANLRAGSGCPGVSSGAAPVRSQVFERLWPPGPVAILGLTGLAVNDRRVGWVHLWLVDDRIVLCCTGL